jgi:predicted  nucleic acid-binding Zn-ribbon protein
MQEEALTAQAQMNRQASDAVHAAEIRVRTEMQSVIKDKEAEIGELHKDIQELRQLAAAAQRDHDKVASEVEQELHALAAQHREVVATLEERVRTFGAALTFTFTRLGQFSVACRPQCVSQT